MYRCDCCKTVSKPGEPQRRYTIRRKDRSVEREIKTCDPCMDALCNGVPYETLAKNSVRYALPRNKPVKGKSILKRTTNRDLQPIVDEYVHALANANHGEAARILGMYRYDDEVQAVLARAADELVENKQRMNAATSAMVRSVPVPLSR